MTSPLFCSIIITNHNHGRFVAEAVESALAQTWPHMETIVVDDGSTDGSLQAIKPYEDRVKLVAKGNGGQASAMNAGFAQARGEIVFFLDSDDRLERTCVERVARAWRPGFSKVHFFLQQVTADGTPIPGRHLPPYHTLPAGDLAPAVRRFGFYPSPPTSGNAFARGFLEKVMPIPEAEFRGWADTYLIGAAPLCGAVGALPGVGGDWRRHDNNLSRCGLGRTLAKLKADEAMILKVRALSGPSSSQGIRALWPQHLKERLLLARFLDGAAEGGLAARFALAAQYMRSVVAWPEYAPGRRVLLLAWGLAMLAAPAALLRAMPRIAGGMRL